MNWYQPHRRGETIQCNTVVCLPVGRMYTPLGFAKEGTTRITSICGLGERTVCCVLAVPQCAKSRLFWTCFPQCCSDSSAIAVARKNMVKHFHSACCRTSYFPPHLLRPTFSFSMDISIGDRVFYTCSNGVRVPARLVETGLEGFSTSPSPSRVPMHHLTTHPALDLNLVGDFLGGYREADLLLGAVCALCPRCACVLQKCPLGASPKQVLLPFACICDFIKDEISVYPFTKFLRWPCTGFGVHYPVQNPVSVPVQVQFQGNGFRILPTSNDRHNSVVYTLCTYALFKNVVLLYPRGYFIVFSHHHQSKFLKLVCIPTRSRPRGATHCVVFYGHHQRISPELSIGIIRKRDALLSHNDL